MTDKNTSPKDTKDDSLRVRKGRVESVDLYEVKDSELDILEKGSPADIQFNFAIFLISISISFFISLLTTDITNITTKIVFIVLTIGGFFGAIYLFFSWHSNHTSLKSVCKKIRDRIPVDLKINEADPAGSASDSPDLPKDQ